MHKTGFYINWSNNTFCFDFKKSMLNFISVIQVGAETKEKMKKKKIEVGSDSTPCLEVVAIGFVTCRQIGSKPSFLKKIEYSFAVGKKYKSNEKR